MPNILPGGMIMRCSVVVHPDRYVPQNDVILGPTTIAGIAVQFDDLHSMSSGLSGFILYLSIRHYRTVAEPVYKGRAK